MTIDKVVLEFFRDCSSSRVPPPITPRIVHTIFAQTHYATGQELRVMINAVKRTEAYLSGCSLSMLNAITLKSRS